MEKTEILDQIKDNIEKIGNKDFGIYFFTMDTKGSPTAGVANVYEHVKILTELGYKAYILHEKNDYANVGSWLGEEYAELPDRKSTRLNSSHVRTSRMPSSA